MQSDKNIETYSSLQTRTPEDSRLIVSIPDGCNIASQCDLFVGISTNEDNSSFFDFYIEGEADGWVAVGFSETQDMVGRTKRRH